jgi:transposase
VLSGSCNGVEKLLVLITEGADERIPQAAHACLISLAAQLAMVKRQILEADRRVLAWHRSSELSRRLEAIPGVGPLIATALVASIPDPAVFRSGRDLSAWIGLVPKQNSTGGKERLGSISKAGHQCIRYNTNHPWFEFSQQLNKRARAFDLLISGYVSAHEARIRFCRWHGNPLASDLTEIEIQVVAGDETFDVDIEKHIVRFSVFFPL